MKSTFYRIFSRLKKLYWFIFKPKTNGVKVIIEYGEEILMIKNTYGKDVWTFPGGAVERNEKPEDAAIREVQEEIGISITQLKTIGNLLNTREYKRDTVFCYIALVKNKTVNFNTSEIKETKWFNKNQLPVDTSLISKEIISLWRTNNLPPSMKALRFADNLIPLILSGEKYSTWRLFDDKDLQVGDDLKLAHNTGQEFALAKIIGIREKSFTEINDRDFAGHEKFDSYEKMLSTYQSYYGDSVKDDTIVKMIDFKIVSFS